MSVEKMTATKKRTGVAQWFAEFERIYANNPSAGAEYLGDCTKISMLLGTPEEAGIRARLAARFAARVQQEEMRELKEMGIVPDLL